MLHRSIVRKHTYYAVVRWGEMPPEAPVAHFHVVWNRSSLALTASMTLNERHIVRRTYAEAHDRAEELIARVLTPCPLLQGSLL